MRIALRVVALVTLILGAGLFSGILSGRFGEVHMLFGIGTAVLALVIFGALLRQGAVAGIAAWFPLIPLAIGFAIFSGVGRSMVIIIIHAAVGLLAIGLLEMQFGKQKRLERQASSASNGTRIWFGDWPRLRHA